VRQKVGKRREISLEKSRFEAWVEDLTIHAPPFKAAEQMERVKVVWYGKLAGQ
jgi:hypothetical protein